MTTSTTATVTTTKTTYTTDLLFCGVFINRWCCNDFFVGGVSINNCSGAGSNRRSS